MRTVVVVGLWRSGTSLLRALLDRHPQVALLYEAEVLSAWPLVGRRGSRSDWAARLDLFNGALSRHGLAPGDLPRRPAGRGEAARALYRAHAARRGASIAGEKGLYFERLAQIARDLPEAALVVLHRDPAAVLASVEAAGQTSRHFARLFVRERTLLGIGQLLEDCRRLRLGGASLHELRYEDLAARPEREMRHLADFLEIEFDPEMARLEGVELVGQPEGEHHALVRSGRIEPGRSAAVSLDPAWRAKVERYRRLWAIRLGEPAPPGPLPSAIERTIDHVKAGFARWREAAVRFVYAWAPPGLVEAYRNPSAR